MSYFPTWSTCNSMPGGPATIWSHIYEHDSPITWTCYWIEGHLAGQTMNNAIAVGLIIDKCDTLQSEVDALSGGVDVTMASLLTAMLAATFEELTSFMGITQAYKVAVWDAPFNEEYYAALARGFRKWGT